MSLRLRPATGAFDEAFLFGLRTDPEVAKQSEGPMPSRVEHAQWWCERPPTRALFIVEDQAMGGAGDGSWDRAGMVRWDRVTPDTAWVSIALCPRARGYGYGAQVLSLLEDEARPEGIRHLHAWVKPQNTASLRAFDKAGYDFVGRGVEICFASKAL